MIGRLREVTVSYESAAPTLELEALGWAPRGIKFFEDASSAFREVPPQWWSSLTHEALPSPSVAVEARDVGGPDHQVALAASGAGLGQAGGHTARVASALDLDDQVVERLGAVAADPLIGGEPLAVGPRVPAAGRELERGRLLEPGDLVGGHALGVALEHRVVADLLLAEADARRVGLLVLRATGARRVLRVHHAGLPVLAGGGGDLDVPLVRAAGEAVRVVGAGRLAAPGLAALAALAVVVDAALRTRATGLALAGAGVADLRPLAVVVRLALRGGVGRRLARLHAGDVLVWEAHLRPLAVVVAVALDLGAAGLRGAAARGEGGEGGGGDDDLVQAHGLSFGGSVLARQVVGIRFVGRLAVRLTEKLNDILRCDQNYLREVYNSL